MYMKYIINYNVDCFILQVCSLLVILILSPIENNNRRLEYSEKKLYKKKTRLRAIIVFILNCYFYWSKNIDVVSPLVVAYILVAISLVMGYVKNYCTINNG